MARNLECDASIKLMDKRALQPGQSHRVRRLGSRRSTTAFVLKKALPLAIAALFALGTQLYAHPSFFPAAADKKSDAPQGFEIFLKVPEADVIRAVQQVTENDTIQGTQVYAREKELTDAVAETSSAYYGEWKGEGHAFYKVRRNALAPRNFKESTDIGVITVRYIVQGVAPNKTRLQIDAVFVEDGNHKVHASDTTVETSEFVEVQSHIVEIQKEQQQTAELAQRREMMVQTHVASKERDQEIARLTDSENSLSGLQQKIDELRHKIEVQVKNDPVELKAAPFSRATKLKSVPARSELLVEIITEYWYGVETVEGQRGWVRRDQVEPLP